MPFTPFHLGFAVLIIGLFPYVDPVAICLGTILIDIEGIIYLLFGVGNIHGPLHSLLGVITLFLPITAISWILAKYAKFNRYYKFNLLISALSGIVGLLSHIFFDAIIYREMTVFYPISYQTGILYGLWSTAVDYLILFIFGCVGLIIILCRYHLKKKKNNNYPI